MLTNSNIVIIRMYLYGGMNSGFWLKEQSIKNRDKIAVTDGNHSITFKELYDKALSISEHILSLNLNRVGLYIKNDIASIALINACWLANVEIAMLNTRLTETEMINQMNSINITTILTTQSFHLSHFNVIHLSELEQYPSHTNDETFNDERIASIMFTSGTTGPQKQYHKHLKIIMQVRLVVKSLGYDETTKWLSVLPIYHISGLSVLLRSIIEGFTVRILEKYNTQTMLAIIKAERPTHVSLVPQTLKWLMDAGLSQPFSIEKILLGGAKLSSTLIDEALNYHLPIYNSFGMTETCSQF